MLLFGAICVQEMSGVSVPGHTNETQNGTVDKEGRAGEDNLLLQKLLEQNRQVKCTVSVYV